MSQATNGTDRAADPAAVNGRHAAVGCGALREMWGGVSNHEDRAGDAGGQQGGAVENPHPERVDNGVAGRQGLPHEDAKPAEATPDDYQPDPCKFCGGPVKRPKRRGLIKLFCRDRCRAAFRDHAITDAVDNAEAVMVEVQDEQERLHARLEGALLRLRTAIGARKLRAKKVVDAVSIGPVESEP